jgi:hypothetical protein
VASDDGVHPTVLVQVGDQSAEIDELLAPVIEAIWQAGLETFTCCQDLGESNASWLESHPHMASYVESRRGWMLIDFPINSGLGFLNAVANAGPRDAFYSRMTHWAAPDAWETNVKAMDLAMFSGAPKSSFGLQLLQVSFPAYDLAELLRRLHEHLAARNAAPAAAN